MLNPDPRAASDRSNEREPDVRDIIDHAERIGELARINGADWNLEIGVLAIAVVTLGALVLSFAKLW